MKVVFNETKFIVNEEKNVVTCIITASLSPTSRQNKVGYFLSYPFVDSTGLCSRYVVTGVAKCHAEDKFDLKRGKMLAESRAKAKVYEEGLNRYKSLLRYVDIFGEDVQDQIEKLKKYHKKEKEHLVELKSEVDEIATECPGE